MGLKKNDKFMVLLSNISKNLTESADFFSDFKINNVSDLKIFSEKMKEYETKGDTFVHDVITELNTAFITPIEREDIMHLAMSMDDVLDGIEACAALFEMYNITKTDEHMENFVSLIKESTHEIDKAVELLSNKKLLSIREHTIKVKDHESKCDHILRKSIKQLFATEKDPITIIKYKEIYENLEKISDFAQSTANTLETIIMKNA
jgi:hypothetical protein